MTLTGTVRNGAVILDPGTQLPEGARVELRLVDEDDFDWDETEAAFLPADHPMALYDRETELAILRESIAEAKAGYPGRPLDEVMKELAAKYKLPPVNTENP